MTRPLITRWHAFASRHVLLLNGLLLLVGVAAAIDLAWMRADADWLAILDRDDPELLRLQAAGDPAASMYRVYVRVGPENRNRASEITSAIAAHPAVASVQTETGASDTSGDDIWLSVALADDPPRNVDQRRETLANLRTILRAYNLHGDLTGSEAIMERYSNLVSRDLMRSSLIAAALVTLIVLLLVDSPVGVAIGLLYEALGLLIALSLYRRLFGSLNMISAAVPGILIGLGADYVIHTVIASGRGHTSQNAGLRAYRIVGRPMFAGALTTAAAFGSLALVGPRGIAQVGGLGALGVVLMFAVVFLFLPPTLSRFPDRSGTRRPPRQFARYLRRVRTIFPLRDRATLVVAWTVGCVAIALSAVSWRVSLNTQLPTSYYPDMPEVVLLEERIEVLGVYPALLYLTVRTSDSRTLLAIARAAKDRFLVVPHSLRVKQEGNEGPRVVTAQLLSMQDPFVKENLTEIIRWLDDQLGEYGTVELTGEALLTHHLSGVISAAMIKASVCMVGLLAVTLILLYRRVRFVVAPILVLLVAMGATLGAISLTGKPLNIFSITILPLLLGIGVDDCLYLSEARATGARVRDTRRLVRALALTTLTTVAGYSSLLAAANRGLIDMGRIAVIGLVVFFVCTLCLLPWLLTSNQQILRQTTSTNRESDSQFPS